MSVDLFKMFTYEASRCIDEQNAADAMVSLANALCCRGVQAEFRHDADKIMEELIKDYYRK